MEVKETLKKVGTLGGAIQVNPNMKKYYFGESESGGNFSKEKLFGVRGPLHPGMPVAETPEEQMVLNINASDTRATLIREIVEQTSLNRYEAEEAIDALLRKGKLEYRKQDGKKILTFVD